MDRKAGVDEVGPWLGRRRAWLSHCFLSKQGQLGRSRGVRAKCPHSCSVSDHSQSPEHCETPPVSSTEQETCPLSGQEEQSTAPALPWIQLTSLQVPPPGMLLWKSCPCHTLHSQSWFSILAGWLTKQPRTSPIKPGLPGPGVRQGG